MKLLASPILKFVLPSLLLFGVLRVVFWLVVFPNPDEAYYWLWGQHPGLSYYDHPPLQAWVQGLFTSLLGRSHLTLRLPNLISTLIFFYTYLKICHYLYGKTASEYFWVTVSLVLASPLYFLFLALAWHDHLLITLSLIAAYLFITFLDGYVSDGHGETKRLYGAAIAIGLAGLCKYNAVFVVLGFVATILSDRRLRQLLRDYRLYLAGAIALCFLLPILLWNLANNFESFQYYVNRSINTGGISLKLGGLLTFVLVSILTLSPIHCVALLQLLKRPRPLTDSDTLYTNVAFWVFVSSTVPLTILSLISAALYYWNITAYLLLFPLLPVVFFSNQQSAKAGKKQQAELSTPPSPRSLPLFPSPLYLGTQVYGVLFAALLVVHYGLLPLSALVSPDADPDSRMLFGWDQIAAKVGTQIEELGGNPLLITTDYRSASALAYQLNDRNVIAISDRVDQFDFWYKGAHIGDSLSSDKGSSKENHSLTGKDAVLLADDWHPLQPQLLAQFHHTSSPIVLSVDRFSRRIKRYYLVKGYQFKGLKG
jgi:hypothetical protein